MKVDVSRRQTIRRQATTIHGVVCVSANQGMVTFLQLETNRNKHPTGKSKDTSCFHCEPSPVTGTAVLVEGQHRCKFGLIRTSRRHWSNQQLSPPPSPVAFRNGVNLWGVMRSCGQSYRSYSIKRESGCVWSLTPRLCRLPGEEKNDDVVTAHLDGNINCHSTL